MGPNIVHQAPNSSTAASTVSYRSDSTMNEIEGMPKFESRQGSDLEHLKVITYPEVIEWLVGKDRNVTAIKCDNECLEIWITSDKNPEDPNARYIRFTL